MTAMNITSNLSQLVSDFPTMSIRIAGHMRLVTGSISVLSNLLIIISHARVEELQSEHRLVPFLAICDMCGGIGEVIHAASPHYTYRVDQRSCVVIQIFSLFASTLNPETTAALSIYRFVGIKYPLFYKRLVSKRVLIILYTGMIAYFCLSYAGLLYLSNPTEIVRMCVLATAVGRGPFGTTATLVVFSITIIIVAINAMLFRQLKLQKRQGEKREAEKKKDKRNGNNKRNTRATESLIIVSVVYVFTFVFGVTAFVFVRMVHPPHKAREILYTYTGQVSCLNYASNYFIYAARSADYRKIFKKSTTSTTRVHNIRSVASTKVVPMRTYVDKEKY